MNSTPAIIRTQKRIASAMTAKAMKRCLRLGLVIDERVGDWDSRSSRRVVDGECTGVVGGSEKGLADDAEKGSFSFVVVVERMSESVLSFHEERRVGVEEVLLARAVDSLIGILKIERIGFLGQLDSGRSVGRCEVSFVACDATWSRLHSDGVSLMHGQVHYQRPKARISKQR
jgi:hypothetical protein